MAESGQVSDRLTHAAGAVDQHARNAAHITIDEHEGPPLGVPPDAIFGEPGRCKDHPLDLSAKAADELVFLPGVFSGIAQEDAEVEPIRLHLRGADERREERICDSGTMRATFAYRPVLSARAVWFGT